MDLFFPLKEGEILRKEEYFFHTKVNGQLILTRQGWQTEAFPWNSIVAGSLPFPSSPGAALLNLPLHFLWAKLILCNAAIGSVATKHLKVIFTCQFTPCAGKLKLPRERMEDRWKKNELTTVSIKSILSKNNAKKLKRWGRKTTRENKAR